MKKKNNIQVNINLNTANILNHFKKYLLMIVITSLSITRYFLIAWLVLVLTTNAIAFLEITFSVFDEFHFNEWVIYQSYNFVENTVGLGFISNWLPVEAACQNILFEPISESWIGGASNITEQKNGTWGLIK